MADDSQGGTTPPTTVPTGDPPVTEDRWQWPYIDQPWQAKNGRELGAWLIGHLWGRQMHNEPGLRVRVPSEFLAGVAAICVENGVAIQKHSSPALGGSITVDLWT